MSLQVRYWGEQAVALDGQERKIRRELEKSFCFELPLGIGAMSSINSVRQLGGAFYLYRDGLAPFALAAQLWAAAKVT